MSNDANSPSPAGSPAGNGASVQRPTLASGATKVFREFKWGLLTLFLLMVVVIALVYDGGRKKDAAALKKPAPTAPGDRDGAGSAANLAGLTAPEGQPPGSPGGAANPADGSGGSVVSAHGPGGALAPSAPPSLGEIPSGPPSYSHSPGVAVIPGTLPGSSETKASYAIQPGDTLEGISRKLFPNRVQTGMKALVEANHITDPHRVRAGATLKVPTLAPLAEKKAGESTPPAKSGVAKAGDTVAKAAEAPKTAKSGGAIGEEGTYVVQAGDSLERIARHLFNDPRRWRELYEMNRDQVPEPGLLRTGQKLKFKSAEATATEPKDAPKTAAHADKTEKTDQKETKVASHDAPAGEAPRTMESSTAAPAWMP